jgi:chromosome segregation ATPase
MLRELGRLSDSYFTYFKFQQSEIQVLKLKILFTHHIVCCLMLLLQLRAELEAGLEVVREASQQAESEREKIRNQRHHLEKERRRLEDYERDLTSRARELETLTQVAVATKAEGRWALEEARRIEKQRSEQAADIQKQLAELRDREKRLAQVRFLNSDTDSSF